MFVSLNKEGNTDLEHRKGEFESGLVKFGGAKLGWVRLDSVKFCRV